MDTTTAETLPNFYLDVESRGTLVIVAFVFFGFLYQHGHFQYFFNHVKARIDAWKYLFYGPEMIQAGYSKVSNMLKAYTCPYTTTKR